MYSNQVLANHLATKGTMLLLIRSANLVIPTVRFAQLVQTQIVVPATLVISCSIRASLAVQAVQQETILTLVPTCAYSATTHAKLVMQEQLMLASSVMMAISGVGHSA